MLLSVPCPNKSALIFRVVNSLLEFLFCKLHCNFNNLVIHLRIVYGALSTSPTLLAAGITEINTTSSLHSWRLYFSGRGQKISQQVH